MADEELEVSVLALERAWDLVMEGGDPPGLESVRAALDAATEVASVTMT